jgi:hypothetical protein
VYTAWNDGDETDDYSAACDAAFDAIRTNRDAALDLFHEPTGRRRG